jgi:hypothetical protein
MPTLDWLDREAAFRAGTRVSTRVLRPHDSDHQFGDASDNLLVQGDNLEHSQWPSMILPRLQLLREFLREDGSIWVTIDDHEAKQEVARVFGRHDMFGTPKPERLIQRVLHIATQAGDLVLGSFLGSDQPGRGVRAHSAAGLSASRGITAARSAGRAAFAMLYKLERGMNVSQQIDAALR